MLNGPDHPADDARNLRHEKWYQWKYVGRGADLGIGTFVEPREDGPQHDRADGGNRNDQKGVPQDPHCRGMGNSVQERPYGKLAVDDKAADQNAPERHDD
jgi:hypothetical protein